MLVAFNKVKEVSRQEWDYRYQAKGQPESIKLHRLQHHYVQYGQAWCQISISPIGNYFFVDGVISFHKRHGQELIRQLLKNFKGFTCRIVCETREHVELFKTLGFRVDYTSDDYWELSVKEDKFIKYDICYNCSRYWNGRCLLKMKEASPFHTCDKFFSASITQTVKYYRG